MGFEVCGRKTMAKDSQHGRSSSLSLSVWIKKIKENVWYKVIHRGHWKGTNGGVRKALLWDGQALAQDWIPWGLSKRQGRGGGGEIKGGPNLEWNLGFFFFSKKWDLWAHCPYRLAVRASLRFGFPVCRMGLSQTWRPTPIIPALRK